MRLTLPSSVAYSPNQRQENKKLLVYSGLFVIKIPLQYVKNNLVPYWAILFINFAFVTISVYYLHNNVYKVPPIVPQKHTLYYIIPGFQIYCLLFITSLQNVYMTHEKNYCSTGDLISYFKVTAINKHTLPPLPNGHV